jgi:hypothetical protein
MKPIIQVLSIASDQQPLRQLLCCAALLVAALLLAACGGGASTETNPASSNTNTVESSSYDGPNAQTDDVRAFQVHVWERLRLSDRCGACHVEANQAPMFVRQDDVNLAYSEANSLIDLDEPANSRLVTKVAGGHNCWVPSDAACAQAITGYIEDWVAGTSAGGRQIQLVAPANLRDPGSTLSFPDTAPAEFDGVWNLLQTYCVGCHIDSSPTAQTPFFASGIRADAYEAAKSKINLEDPAASRLVVRLRDEFHNCWTQCGADAQTMENAIIALAGSSEVSSDPVQEPVVFSKALTLPEGVLAAGGNRHEADVIALYEFKTGSGSIALDSSGVLPELNLTLSGDVNWVGGWGIQIVNGKAQGSTSNSRKLHDLIKATGEYSIEAWVVPANVTQEGPARIITYSAGTDARNFTLGQTQYNYDFLQRSSTTDGNGEPALSTADADEDLQATLQHVVVTFDPLNGRRTYVNGVFTDDADPAAPGNLNDWDDSYALALGNEVSNNRQWTGSIRMVAIHNRALTQQQIVQNFEVGVGEKFFLLFSIGDISGIPADSYIMFEVSQFDSYSYLFDSATYINLDPAVSPGSIPLQGMRIGINGKEAAVGQAYRNLDTSIDGASYDPASGQPLSSLGTIIALENGPDSDEFFLTFEVLGDETNVVTEVSPLTPPPVPTPLDPVTIGVRTFDEVNAAMAAMTGVDAQLVKDQFDILRQQLPAVETIEGFLSAHQMGVAQLAIAYCDNLVESSARNAFFTGALAAGFNFNANVYDAFAGDRQVDVIDDLYDRMIGIPRSGIDLSLVPTRAEVQLELNNPVDGPDLDVTLDPPLPATPDGLYDRLRFEDCSDSPPPATVPAACNAVRTRAIVKALCASTLGSAAMLVQ